MNNPEPTDMKGTQIRDLIDMVQKRMGIDLESLSANPDGNLVSGSTFAIAPSRVMPQIWRDRRGAGVCACTRTAKLRTRETTCRAQQEPMRVRPDFESVDW